MANVSRDGVVYNTEDLLRMANIGAFGDMSEAVWGALIYIKNLEKENVQLKAHIAKINEELNKSTQQSGEIIP